MLIKNDFILTKHGTEPIRIEQAKQLYSHWKKRWDKYDGAPGENERVIALELARTWAFYMVSKNKEFDEMKPMWLSEFYLFKFAEDESDVCRYNIDIMPRGYSGYFEIHLDRFNENKNSIKWVDRPARLILGSGL